MLVRLIIWLVVAFLIYTVVQIVKQALFKPPPPPAERSSRGEEMVRDPECGTYVPRSDAVRGEKAGRELYFCSARCRDKHLNSRN
jgi:YHS domain-containing protein